MAVKTFTSGEVLTAADTNTFLANAGLVYVTSGSFTSSTAVQVNSCFTSTYRDYRVILIATGASATANTFIQLSKNGTASATGYGYAGFYAAWGSASFGGTQQGNATTVYLGNTDSGTTTSMFDITFFNPQTTNQANYIIQCVGAQNTYMYMGRHGVNDNMDGFKYYPSTGNVTGSYVVYGLRGA